MPNSTLAFTMQTQVQPNWCWAAVATSTADFYSNPTPHTQCSVVNAVLSPGICCCTSGASPACDVPYSLEKALQHTFNWRSTSRGASTWPTVDTEITNQHPIGVQIALIGGSAHFLAIIGTGTRSNDKIVCEDPFGGRTTTKLKQLASSAHGTWRETYFTH